LHRGTPAPARTSGKKRRRRLGRAYDSAGGAGSLGSAKRRSTWAALNEAFGPSRRRGAVLVGPAGAGKTELARTVLQHRRREQPHTVLHWVAGTASASRIPFGGVQPSGRDRRWRRTRDGVADGAGVAVRTGPARPHPDRPAVDRR